MCINILQTLKKIQSKNLKFSQKKLFANKLTAKILSDTPTEIKRGWMSLHDILRLPAHNVERKE